MIIVDDPLALSLDEIQNRLQALNETQKRILELLMRGKKNKVISLLLSIRLNTIRVQISRAVDQTGVYDRTVLLILYSVWLFARGQPCNESQRITSRVNADQNEVIMS